MSITLQISDEFRNVIMHCDVISCVIGLSNYAEYFEKEEREFYPGSYIVIFSDLCNSI